MKNNNTLSKETQARAKEIADRPSVVLQCEGKKLVASNPIMIETLKKMGYVETNTQQPKSAKPEKTE